MTQVSRFFRNLKIRSKLLGGYTLIFVLATLVGGAVIYQQVRATIEANIESELTTATETIQNMVRTAAATSIKNHLKAIAEKNKEIVQAIYKDFLSGLITEDAAKELCRKILFSQTIGKTGYIFCANSDSIAIEHPNPGVAGKNFSNHRFVHDMIRMKTGYLEYDWKNPEDAALKPKAMYMSYFEPWDWIIAASTYREEFNALIHISDFRDSILSLRFGKTGYAYINDTAGNLIVHPFMTGNYYDSRDRDGRFFVRDICKLKNGKAVYTWKNPGETLAREKMVIFKYIPEYDWIVCSASYLDEIFAPLKTIRNIIFGIAFLICVLVFSTSLWVNATVILPLQSLMKRFNMGASGNFNIRMPVESTDEIGQLADYFNRFMDTLDQYGTHLKSEINGHKMTAQALKLSEEMFSKAFTSSPSSMFIAALKDLRLMNVNDSFLGLTGYRSPDLIGKELTTIGVFCQPGDKKKELGFYTASGEKRTGMISVEQITLWNEPCILGAIEDMTDARRLEREILTIGERERQKIAMDLHDDLCPQLIGIEVMLKMLQQRLREKAPQGPMAWEADRAGKIRTLIRDAIEKTRGLSRGLSPVNLADRGLDASLEELAAYIRQVFHFSCTLSWDTSQAFKDNETATHAYYIAHEAVHNAVKHSKGNLIRICLTNQGKLVTLTIEDNGIGLGNPSPGMGIRIMSYRASRIGASLGFEKILTGGTRVRLELLETCTLEKESPWEKTV
ncbi:MAG: cache domain-containing protein [Proteobacteria bacterium]|nr:cache domain-containing protein [Pseudomonadota bacterium]